MTAEKIKPSEHLAPHVENVDLQLEARVLEYTIRHSRDGSVPELWERLRAIGARIKALGLRKKLGV